MKRAFMTLFTITGIFFVFLVLPCSIVHAKSSDDTATKETTDLGSVKDALNEASSIALVADAWQALEENDLESVVALTNECIDRFSKRARQMQKELKGYVTGSEADVRKYWALNDVATSYFIQGKAFQNAKEYDQAQKAYKKLINNYSFGQCWEPKGWFWKPAEVAKENLGMIDSGIFFDFGDYASSTLLNKAWEALEREDVDRVQGYADKCIQLYDQRAREMQAALDQYPKGSDDEIFKYWALNDVATAHFIKAKAYMIQGKNEEMADEFRIIHDDFFFGQCWDPRGWWWKPTEESDNWLKIFDEKNRSGESS